MTLARPTRSMPEKEKDSSFLPDELQWELPCSGGAYLVIPNRNHDMTCVRRSPKLEIDVKE